MLLKKVTNSSEEISLENYYRAQKALNTLKSILDTQNSKVKEKKELNINKVYCKTFNKLSDVSINDIKANAQQRSSSLKISELTTKAKVIKQKDITSLIKSNQNIKNAINIFINDLNKEAYWQPSEKEYQALCSNLLALQNKIDKFRNNILSSSYQHNPNKLTTLTQLESKLAQLSSKLQSNYQALKITNQSDSHITPSQKFDDENSNLNTQHQLNNNEISSAHLTELAQLKTEVSMLESEVEQLKSERQKSRNKLNELQSKRLAGRNLNLKIQVNNDDYVKNQGFQAAIKNENA